MSSHAWYEFFVKFSIKYTHKKAEVIISALVLFDKLIGTINILKIKEYIFSNYLIVCLQVISKLCSLVPSTVTRPISFTLS